MSDPEDTNKPAEQAAPESDENGGGLSPVPESVASGSDREAKSPRARKSARRNKRTKARAQKWQPLDKDGRERPAFLQGFPDDPELQELCQAFELGNYALVRERAPRLAERSQDSAVKAAALELAERIKPDPLLRYILLASVLLLLYLIGFAYMDHGH